MLRFCPQADSWPTIETARGPAEFNAAGPPLVDGKHMKKTVSPTSHRGGHIERIGDKEYRLTWHQGRGKPNIRRTIYGTRETAAAVLQKIREEFYAGNYGIKIEHETTIKDLAQLVVNDYQANNFKDLRGALQLQKFWKTLAESRRADTIDSNQLTTWSNDWRANGLSSARTNRRIAFLLRGYRLAKEKSLVNEVPAWTALKEAPPRSGTRTWEEFLNVRSLLPPHARVPVTIEFWLGTRSGETLAIGWSQVRFQHARQLVEIRLDAENTKTSEQRVAVMGGDLYTTLRDWHTIVKAQYPTCQTVCSYRGKPLKSIRTSWQTACVKVGLGRWGNPEGKEVGNRKYSGALVHDFRRTAIGRMEDAGIPRKTAMSISGHKTDSVYRRYHVVRKADLVEAGQRIMAHHEREHGAVTTPGNVFTDCSLRSQKTAKRTESNRTYPTRSKRANTAHRANK